MKPTRIILLLIFLTLGGTKYYTAIAARTGKHDTPAENTTKLIGAWRLDKIEAPDMIAKMSSYTSQAEKDALVQGISKYQDAMKGLKVIFNKDSTYESSYSGQNDKGTWRINKQEIQTASKLSGAASVFQIVSVNTTTLVVKYNPGDAELLMTLIKQ